MEQSSFKIVGSLIGGALLVAIVSFGVGKVIGVKAQAKASPYAVPPSFEDEFSRYEAKWTANGGKQTEIRILGFIADVDIVATTRGSAFGFSKAENNPKLSELRHLLIDGCTVRRVNEDILFWSFENPFRGELLKE